MLSGGADVDGWVNAMLRRNTLVLLALFLIALIGAIWYSQREEETVPETSLSPTVEPLWFLPEAEIAGLTIEDLNSGERIQAKREPEVGWSLIEPEGGMANVARIERAVTSLQLITPIERIDTNDFAQFGLDQPDYQIVLSLVDDSNRGLSIGRLAPTGDVYYARLGETDEVLFLQRSSIQSAIELVEVPPIVTPTPELTSTPAAE